MSMKRKAVTSLTLDLSMPDVQAGFTCTLGDRMRVLEILITDGGRPVEMLSRWSAFLSGVKPDETELVNGCVVQDGKLIYDFESGEQIATCAGRYAVTVWIMDENGTPVASPKIWVNVIDSGVQAIMNNNQSEDQFGVLQEIVEDINDLFLKDEEIDAEIDGLKVKDTQVDAEITNLKLFDIDARHQIQTLKEKDAQVDEEINGLKENTRIAFEGVNREFAGVKNQIEDIDASIKQAAEEIIQAKQDIEKMISVESVTVARTKWTGTKSAQALLKGATDPDTVFFFFPADEQTKTAATKARMTIKTFVPSVPSYGALYATLVVEDERFVKETDLTFTVLHVREEGATERRAVLVGVDSYGDIISTSIDLSRLDDGEVVETFSDGTTKTTTIEYDADGNPIKITDGDGNETVLTW